MNYKRALITGGAGLIGSHIADELVADGFEEIVVLDNLTRGRRQNLDSAAARGNLTFVEGDIREPTLVREAMEGIDIVFHEAAIRITQTRGGSAARPRRAGNWDVQHPRSGRGGEGETRRGRFLGLHLRSG
jgi:nucleoside-diphosphate-sugar epimerase